MREPIPPPFDSLYDWEGDEIVLREPPSSSFGPTATIGAVLLVLAVAIPVASPDLLGLSCLLGAPGAGVLVYGLAKAGSDLPPLRIGAGVATRNGRRFRFDGVGLAGRPGEPLAVVVHAPGGEQTLFRESEPSRATYEALVAMAGWVARHGDLPLYDPLDHDAWVRFYEDPDEPRRVALRRWVDRSRRARPELHKGESRRPPDVLMDVDQLRWRGLLLHPHGLQSSGLELTMEDVLAIDVVFTGFEGVIAATAEGVVTLLPLTASEAPYGRWFVEQVRQAMANAGDRGSHEDVPEALRRVSAGSTEKAGS